MDAIARIQLTRAYFEESYDEWYRHVFRWRKWQAPVGAAAGLAVAPALYFGNQLFAGFLAAFCVLELTESLTHRWRWVRERLKSLRLDAHTTLRFTDDGIEHDGPFATGKMAWSGIHSYTVTGRGIFLRPEPRVSIYIPKSSVEPPDGFDDIVSLATAALSRESRDA